MKTVLIIDDEEKLRSLLARIISLEGFEVFVAGDCRSALKKLEQTEMDVVLCDVKLPDGNGVELVKKIKEKYASVEIILLTAYGNIADGVKAIKNGAFDYITKGDDNNKIIPLLNKAIEKVTLSKMGINTQKTKLNTHTFQSIIGRSKAISEAITLARKVAQTDTTVLLTGESGTGKELFAQAIHNESDRKSSKFVAINCAAFTKDMLESELFGYKSGAFTGANKDKKGIFEEANEGTLFLDEIGEMALDLQSKLLRVIEAGSYIKMGETAITRLNVRLICATNRILNKEINAGYFRQDLFYRISAFQIQLPSLNERKEDIEAIANYYLHHFALKMKKQVSAMSADFVNALQMHYWKGNIRELRNVMERSVILVENAEINIDCLPMEFNMHQNFGLMDSFEMAEIEKMHINKVLHYTRGNKSEAARLLNIGIATLYRKIEEYKL